MFMDLLWSSVVLLGAADVALFCIVCRL